MRDVSLFMLQDESVAVDDFVKVHVGYALQKMTEQEARSTWELLDEMLVAEAAASMIDAVTVISGLACV